MVIVVRLDDDGWADPGPDIWRGDARQVFSSCEGGRWDLPVKSKLLLKYPGPLAA
jgi:hypothetical protein